MKRTLAVAVVNHYKRLLAGDGDRRPRAQGRRDRQEQRPPDRPDRLRQDGAGADPGPAAQRPLRHRRRHHPDRGRLRRRGRREPDPQARPRGRLRHPAGRRGIIYIDEIDKIGKTSQNVSITRDVSGEGVQQALLEDARRDGRQRTAAGGRKHPEQQYLQVDTTQHPVHLRRDLRRPRRDHRQAAGAEDDRLRPCRPPTTARTNANELVAQVTPEDLERFGMIPELIGRLPVISTLNQLSVADLRGS